MESLSFFLGRWLKTLGQKLNELISYKVENLPEIEVNEEKNNIEKIPMVYTNENNKLLPLIDEELTTISQNNTNINNSFLSRVSPIKKLSECPQLNTKRVRDEEEIIFDNDRHYDNNLSLCRKNVEENIIRKNFLELSNQLKQNNQKQNEENHFLSNNIKIINRNIIEKKNSTFIKKNEADKTNFLAQYDKRKKMLEDYFKNKTKYINSKSFELNHEKIEKIKNDLTKKKQFLIKTNVYLK